MVDEKGSILSVSDSFVSLDDKAIATYIKGIKNKKIESFDIPKEFCHDLKFVKAERENGFRHLVCCGFEAPKNQFFIEDTIKLPADESSEDDIFWIDSFNDFYDSLGGEIYKKSSFYGYNFSAAEIQKYGLDIKRLNKGPFIQENIDGYQAKLISDEKSAFDKAEKNKEKLKPFIEQISQCQTASEFGSILQKADRRFGRIGDSFLFFYFLGLHKENAFEIVTTAMNKEYFAGDFYACGLCYFFDPEKVLSAITFSSCSSSTLSRRRKMLRTFVAGLEDHTIEWKHKRFFDKDLHYYVDEVTAPTGLSLLAYARSYFETFQDFAKHLNNDLSGCDLSSSNISKTDLAGCRIDTDTRLPISCCEGMKTEVTSKAGSSFGPYEVKISWLKEDDSLAFEKDLPFDHFVDYAFFLKGDFANADLLHCDGLLNLKDLTGLNFSKAHLPSTFFKKNGLPYEKIDFLLGLPKPSSMILANEEKTSEALSSQRYDVSETDRPIFYVSDLHLPVRILSAHCSSGDDITILLQKMAHDFVNYIDAAIQKKRTFDVLLIGGDTTSNPLLFKMFVDILGSQIKKRHTSSIKVVFVLGNHEFCPFQSKTAEEINGYYRNLIQENGMFLLDDSLLAFDDDGSGKEIPADVLLRLTKDELQALTGKSRVLIFGGTGFAGFNDDFNAEKGQIYNKAMTRSQEIEETKKFFQVYSAVKEKLGNKKVVVLTHNPPKDWMPSENYQKGFIYVSGHTHLNVFHDDGEIRYYADNQMGLSTKEAQLKYFYLDDKYDLLESLPEGIGSISKNLYLDFLRGKGLNAAMKLDVYEILALKKHGIYCFFYRTPKGQLVFLSGGQKRSMPCLDINYYFNNMDLVVSNIVDPLTPYNGLLETISQNIKRIGGSGLIHGCIVDIDYYNHIYLNPNDLKPTFYFALNIVDKCVYPSLLGLLSKKCPELYKKATLCLENKEVDEQFFLAKSESQEEEWYFDTDIYKASRLIKKMQRLANGILSVWIDPKNPLMLGNAKELK
jgi:predicted MPP superfamily phosphohydrolase